MTVCPGLEVKPAVVFAAGPAVAHTVTVTVEGGCVLQVTSLVSVVTADGGSWPGANFEDPVAVLSVDG